MEPIAQRLKEKLDKMTPEEREAEWDKLKHWNEVGPTCEEFFETQKKYMTVTQALDRIKAGNQVVFDMIESSFEIIDDLVQDSAAMEDLYRKMLEWCWTEQYPGDLIPAFVEKEDLPPEQTDEALRWYRAMLEGSCTQFMTKLGLYTEEVPQEELYRRRANMLNLLWQRIQEVDFPIYKAVIQSIRLG